MKIRRHGRMVLGVVCVAGALTLSTAQAQTEKAAPPVDQAKEPAPHFCTDCSNSVMAFDETVGEPFREGWTRRIIYTGNLMMVLIDIDNGPQAQPDPFHSHPHEQAALVVAGEILYFCEGEKPRHLKAGDMYAVASGQKHAIQVLTKHVRLVDTFNPIREDFLKK
jgi:quercetin dioxygenase-like cupin family protein